MSYQYMERDAYSQRRQAPKPKTKPDTFLFVSVYGNSFNCHILQVSGHTFTTVIPLYRNMYPSYVPVGVFKCSFLEARLLSSNFRSWNIETKHFQPVYNEQVNTTVVLNSNSQGLTPIFLDDSNGSVVSTVNNTGEFFGYARNQYFLPLINKMFNARNTNTITNTITPIVGHPQSFNQDFGGTLQNFGGDFPF